MKVVITGSVLIAGLLFVHTSPASDIGRLMIIPEEVRGVCQSYPEARPVSIQAAVEYEVAGQSISAVRATPVSKEWQAFQCGKKRVTIYWYEYQPDADIEGITRSFEEIIWGGSKPSKMHPERILSIGNVVAVVSSRTPSYFVWLLNHRVEFPDVDNVVVEQYLLQLKCRASKPKSASACNALDLFLAGKPPHNLLKGENVLLGEFWEVSPSGKVTESGFEMLYVAEAEGEHLASFSAIVPENPDEERQVIEQISAQRENRPPNGTEAVLSFIRETLGQRRSIATATGNSLAFLGQGGRVYVRQVERGAVVLIHVGSGRKKTAFVLAHFPGHSSR